MSNKLELEAKNLLNILSNGIPEEEKLNQVQETLKSFACSALNQVDTMRKMNVDDKVIKAMVDDIGIDYNLKQKKFV